jgi:hypothetical protein
MKSPSTWLAISALIIFLLTSFNCNGQPKSTYEIGSTPVAGAVEYKFFIEKQSASPYTIQQGIDYLDPNQDGSPTDSLISIGSNTLPLFTLKLDNDGSQYAVGIVAVNAAGIYSAMGTATGNVGTSPGTPAGVFFRKKQ